VSSLRPRLQSMPTSTPVASCPHALLPKLFATV
jgi:hypothetical protein